jgi:hypothetical protein
LGRVGRDARDGLAVGVWNAGCEVAVVVTWSEFFYLLVVDSGWRERCIMQIRTEPSCLRLVEVVDMGCRGGDDEMSATRQAMMTPKTKLEPDHVTKFCVLKAQHKHLSLSISPVIRLTLQSNN